MNREPDPNDPVWQLLRQSPMAEPRPGFTDDVLRAARLAAARTPWWKRFALPLAGVSIAATAAIALAVIAPDEPPAPPAQLAGASSDPEPSLESLDELVRTETLLLAAENPSEFSDGELVALLAF